MSRSRWFGGVLAVGLACFQVSVAAAQDLAVAAASDLQTVLPTIAAQFKRETGRTVRFTFGSSGNFFSQIQNGAPFDVFFSADIDYPRRLEAAGLADPATLTEYARGSLVLWTRKDSNIDVRLGLKVLLDPRVHRLAIANPQHAPYGRAAVAALQHEGIYDQVRDKCVLGENISQTAQFVQSGNAEVGVLALSLALSPALKDAGISYRIPESFHPPIEQAAIVLASSLNKAAARELLAFLKRPEIVELMKGAGFEIP